MKPKTIALLLPALAVLFAAIPRAFAEGKTPPPATTKDGVFVPREKSLSEYEKLRAKSPFEFDPPAPQVDQDIDPFEGYSLAGYCGRGDTLTVYLLSGKEKKRVTVYGDGSPYKKLDTTGIHVVGINRGQTLKATEIILEKDGHQGILKFDEETLHSKGGAQPQVPNGAMMPGQNGTLIPRPPAIPRPAGSPAPQAQNYQAPAPFIPGQSAPPQQQPGIQGGVALPAGIPTQAMTNDQLLKHVMENGQGVQPANMGGVRPQGQNQVDGQHRRKVVLPTTPP